MARLAAEGLVAGFVHGALNIDTAMSLVGESVGYGPFAFLERWDQGFTPADFDQSGLYADGRQPPMGHPNLGLLQELLAMLLPRQELEVQLERHARGLRHPRPALPGATPGGGGPFPSRLLPRRRRSAPSCSAGICRKAPCGR
ncbi:MAG: hypothetical protein ER33_09890 [Cyanobium sp. CACIAM 14]|nr:MAG: hypothetical protein ER33_09890 [Cyanobium sp. CACIAM 14]